MALRHAPQKQSKVIIPVKKQQKEIIQAIATERENLRNIKEQIKLANKELQITQKELEQTKTEIKTEKANKEQYQKSVIVLKDKEKERKDKIKDIEKKILSDEKQAEDSITTQKAKSEAVLNSKNVEMKQIESRISVLNKDIAKKTAESDNLTQQNDSKKKNIKEKEDRISVLDNDIKSKNTELSNIEKRISLLDEKKANVVEIENKYKDLMRQLPDIQQEIKKERKELMNIKTEKDNRLSEAIKKENEVKRQTEELNKKQLQFDIRKRNVERLAKTLQKHFDKQKMPIKVWPEPAEVI